jgi:hypothetical protein
MAEMVDGCGSSDALALRSVERVCPLCGESAGTTPVCSGCGLNVSVLPRLPSRSEWETLLAPLAAERALRAGGAGLLAR